MEKMQAPFRAGRAGLAGGRPMAASEPAPRQTAALMTTPVAPGLATSEQVGPRARNDTDAGQAVQAADAADARQMPPSRGESLGTSERDLDRGARTSGRIRVEEQVDDDLEAEPTHAVPKAERPTVKIQIQTRDVPRGRGGRPRKPEHYPFGELSPITSNGHGQLTGDCFFIPDADNPARQIAAGRKRHRPKVFLTRRVPGGRMVWREK